MTVRPLRKTARRARAIVRDAVRLAAALWLATLLISAIAIGTVGLGEPEAPGTAASDARLASEVLGIRTAPPLTPTATPPATPAPPPPSVPASIPLPSVGSQACSSEWPGKVDLGFAWPRIGSQDVELWLELSLLDNGFQPETFVSAGPLEASTTSYTWRGIRPGDVHYYRLNMRDSDGWRPGPTGEFVSGLCLSPAASLRGVAQACGSGPGEARASFDWSPAIQAGGRQWVDLSLSNNGFAEGTFVSVGPLSAATSTFDWEGLRADSQHYWRINTAAADGWYASATGTFKTATCAAQEPAIAAASAGDDLLALQGRLRDQIEASGMNAAVAVTDLQTGETIDVNGNDIRLPGCTLNFFVLLSVVMDLQAGRYSEAEVGSLIASTIWSSNPITARQLLVKTGAGEVTPGIMKINHLLASLGADSSFYDHPPAYPDHSSGVGRGNTLTANDMNRALTHFYLGGVVDRQWRDYLLEKLTGVKPGLQYLIPSGVSAGTAAHKNGFSWDSGGWVDNDIGIVWFDRGGTRYAYAISFFAEDIPSKYADIPLGQAVSRLAWEYFQKRYP